jgi:hypothetical protein
MGVLAFSDTKLGLFIDRELIREGVAAQTIFFLQRGEIARRQIGRAKMNGAHKGSRSQFPLCNSETAHSIHTSKAIGDFFEKVIHRSVIPMCNFFRLNLPTF